MKTLSLGFPWGHIFSLAINEKVAKLSRCNITDTMRADWIKMLPNPVEFQFERHTATAVERRVEVLSAAANSCIESKSEFTAHRQHSGKAKSL